MISMLEHESLRLMRPMQRARPRPKNTRASVNCSLRQGNKKQSNQRRWNEAHRERG